MLYVGLCGRDIVTLKKTSCFELDRQSGLADGGLGVFDGHGVGNGVPDEEDFFATSRYCGIDEVALEHDEVLFEEGDDDDGKFGALGFVDGDGIGEGEVTELHTFELNSVMVVEFDG